jgi:hypothetical protein
MNYNIVLLIGLIFATGTSCAQATKGTTHRENQLSNNKVIVWKTVIYPASHKALAMHRHEQDRVLVALSDGLLKITNNYGKIHYLKLEKDKAYYLSKNAPGELHNDINVTNHPVKVMVIEIKDNPARK